MRSMGLAAALLVACSVALAAGCGDDGSGKQLTRQEYIAKGDALCTEARQKTPRAPQLGNRQRLASYLDQVAQVSTGVIAKFRDLKPPDELKGASKRFLDAATARLRDVRDAATAAASNNGTALRSALAKQARDAVRYRALARRIGFKVCGSAG